MRPFQYIAILFIMLFIALLALVWADILVWGWLAVFTLAYVLFLFIPITHIQWNYYIDSTNSGEVRGKNIALTFDDSPNVETETILDILKKEKVKAAFFCIGTNVRDNPYLVKRMYDEGHIVGNHSFSHGYHFDWKSTANMVRDMEACNKEIKKSIGVTPLLFRPPYGITNPNLYRAVKKTGMESVGWSLRSFDTSSKDGIELKKKILNNLKGGDIVLLHDSQSITREILTDLIHEARQKGFTFVSLNQLTGLDAYS